MTSGNTTNGVILKVSLRTGRQPLPPGKFQRPELDRSRISSGVVEGTEAAGGFGKSSILTTA